MEEYLTTTELSQRIKLAPGTIRNLVWRNKFKENIHYIKPTPKKLLFIWGRVQEWLHGKPAVASERQTDRHRSLIDTR